MEVVSAVPAVMLIVKNRGFFRYSPALVDFLLPMPMTATILATGHILRGRYQILNELAEGGFGATYLAEDLDLPNRPRCVVKQLRPQSTEEKTLATARRLFEAEAQTLSKLGEHAQIPRLFAYFEEDQEFYLVEEYIEGRSLWEEFQDLSPLAPAEAIAILKDLLVVLGFVHEQGVIHRDLNPSNVIRRQEDQRLCLIDFGAVKQVSNQSAGTNRSTVVIGTQGYFPSEQAQGYPRFSSDIYALGMMAIEALAGQSPEAEGFPVNFETGDVEWQTLADLPEDLHLLLEGMVHPNVEKRFAGVSDVQESLAKINVASVKPNTLILSEKSRTAIRQLQQTAIAPFSRVQTFVSQRIKPVESRSGATKAALAGVGLATLISLGLGMNVGLRWWSQQRAIAAHYNQGQLFATQDQFDQALEQYQHILRTAPEHQRALLGKAEALMALGQPEEALSTFDELLILNPRRWEAWWGKGQIASDRQEYESALDYLDRAIAITDHQAPVWAAKARIHLAQADGHAALASLDQLLSLDRQQDWAWFEKGLIHHRQADYSQAVKAFAKAIDLDPNNPDFWYQQGNSHIKLQQYRPARNAYEQVVVLKANHAPAWFSLGITQEKLNNASKAQVAFSQVTQLEPNNDRAWYHLAHNAEASGDNSIALEAYQQVVSLKKDDRPSWKALAVLLHEDQRYEQAIAAYQNVLRLDSVDGHSWAELGKAFHSIQQYQEAISAYDEALRYLPNDPAILGDRQEAQQQLQWAESRERLKEGADNLPEVLKGILGEFVPWL